MSRDVFSVFIFLNFKTVNEVNRLISQVSPVITINVYTIAGTVYTGNRRNFNVPFTHFRKIKIG